MGKCSFNALVCAAHKVKSIAYFETKNKDQAIGLGCMNVQISAAVSLNSVVQQNTLEQARAALGR